MQLGEPYREAHLAGEGTVPLESIAEGPTVYSTQGLVYYDHGEPTDVEQLMLEMVNRARNDPGAEAARLGIGLNDGLAPGTIPDTPKPPLAPNVFLTDGARMHSDWMLDADIFDHTGEGGSAPADRMAAAGYSLSGTWRTGENIAWAGSTGPIDLGQRTVQMHEGLFKSSGHRTNICDGDFQEIGIGIKEGLFFSQGTNWNAGMATQNFATSSTTPGPFVTGVIYEDANENDSYDMGEGLEGIEVTLTGCGFYAESSASGGYALPFDGVTGSQEITFAGPDWEESSVVALEADTNLKVDLIVDEAGTPWYAASGKTVPAGWRYFDWFKGFKPKDGTDWIYHGRHGWLYVKAENTSKIFLWDGALGRWLFTNEFIYPWLYAYGPDGGWVWFFEGGSPGSRFFERGDNAQTISEEELSL